MPDQPDEISRFDPEHAAEREPTRLVCKSARPSHRTSAVAYVGEPPAPDDPLLGFEPFVHTAPRRNSITPARQRAFISALAATGIVTQAAKSIGVSLEALYKLRNRAGAEGFAAAWDLAVDRGMARLEDCALERAIAGEERVVVRGGEVVATWRRHDTALLTFLLRQRRGQRFEGGGGGGSFAWLRPGHPVYEKLKREWAEQDAAARRAAEERDTATNKAFILKLNRRLGQLREESLATGVMKLGPDGRGYWADPELRAHIAADRAAAEEAWDAAGPDDDLDDRAAGGE